MRQKTQSLFYVLIALCILALTNCNKENTAQPNTAGNTPAIASVNTAARTNARNYITGYLDAEPITITDNPSYFTNSVEQNRDTTITTAPVSYTNAASSNGNAGPGNNSGNGNTNPNGYGYGTNNGSANSFGSREELMTGASWSSPDQQGQMIKTGTVEVRQEIFRIYVTPFLSNKYYNILNAGYHSVATSSIDKNGVYIAIRDNAGVLWATEGDQTGSYFWVTYRGNNMQTHANISAIINCKLYDSNGNVKTFTSNGFNANFGLQ